MQPWNFVFLGQKYFIFFIIFRLNGTDLLRMNFLFFNYLIFNNLYLLK